MQTRPKQPAEFQKEAIPALLPLLPAAGKAVWGLLNAYWAYQSLKGLGGNITTGYQKAREGDWKGVAGEGLKGGMNALWAYLSARWGGKALAGVPRAFRGAQLVGQARKAGVSADLFRRTGMFSGANRELVTKDLMSQGVPEARARALAALDPDRRIAALYSHQYAKAGDPGIRQLFRARMPKAPPVGVEGSTAFQDTLTKYRQAQGWERKAGQWGSSIVPWVIKKPLRWPVEQAERAGAWVTRKTGVPGAQTVGNLGVWFGGPAAVGYVGDKLSPPQYPEETGQETAVDMAMLAGNKMQERVARDYGDDAVRALSRMSQQQRQQTLQMMYPRQ